MYKHIVPRRERQKREFCTVRIFDLNLQSWMSVLRPPDLNEHHKFMYMCVAR
jgi:hypothetical protein